MLNCLLSRAEEIRHGRGQTSTAMVLNRGDGIRTPRGMVDQEVNVNQEQHTYRGQKADETRGGHVQDYCTVERSFERHIAMVEGRLDREY